VAQTIVQEAHLGVIIDILVLVMLYIALEKWTKIGPLEMLKGLLSEAKDLARMKPTAGAINFGTLILALIVMAAYFLSQTFRDIIQAALSVGTRRAAEDTASFTFCFVAVLVAAVLSTACVKFLKD
jgi:hypothetical protein